MNKPCQKIGFSIKANGLLMMNQHIKGFGWGVSIRISNLHCFMHLTALLERVLSLLCEMTDFLTHPDFGKDWNYLYLN